MYLDPFSLISISYLSLKFLTVSLISSTMFMLMTFSFTLTNYYRPVQHLSLHHQYASLTQSELPPSQFTQFICPYKSIHYHTHCFRLIRISLHLKIATIVTSSYIVPLFYYWNNLLYKLPGNKIINFQRLKIPSFELFASTTTIKELHHPSLKTILATYCNKK